MKWKAAIPENGVKVEHDKCGGKIRFPKKVDAVTVANFRMKNGAEYVRAYSCPACFGWHLTKSPDRKGGK